MALLSDYSAGTITVAAGATAVTGSGTAWATAGFKDGDLLIAGGYFGIVGSVETNTALTLAQPWRGGALNGSAYRLRYQGDGSRISAQARQLVELLGSSGNFEALGGLQGIADRLAYFTGAGQMSLTALTAFSRSLLDDANGSTALSTLGVSDFIKTLLDDANAFAARATLGAAPLQAPTFTGNGIGISGPTNANVLTAYWQNNVVRVNVGIPETNTGNYFIDCLGADGVWLGRAIEIANATRRVTMFTGATIDTAANIARMEIKGFGASRGYGMVFTPATDAAAPVLFQNPALGTVGSITTTATATSFNTSSDYRLKTDVEPIVSFALTPDQFDLLDNALLRVMAMRPVFYTWKHAPEAGLQTGFIAHDLQSVAPYAVSGVKDAEEQIGRATIPAKTVPASTIPGETVTVIDPETGELVERQTPATEIPEQIVPAQVFEGVRNGEIEGAEWEQTGTRPIYQGVDHGKITPDLVAAVQSLTLMVLDQRDVIDALTARVAVMEAGQ